MWPNQFESNNHPALFYLVDGRRPFYCPFVSRPKYVVFVPRDKKNPVLKTGLANGYKTKREHHLN